MVKVETQNSKPATEQDTQDAALLWLIATTIAPYWRPLLLALVVLLAGAGLNVLPPYLLGRAIDGPIAAGDTAGLWPIALLYGGAAVLVFVLQYVQTYFLQQAGQRALADLRTRVLTNILRQDQGFFGRMPTGDLVSRLIGDIDSLNALLSTSVVTILTESVTLLAIVGVMLWVNWQLALLALAVLPILLLVTRYFRRRIRGSSKGERTALARISGFLNEHIHGMLLVQLFNRQAASAAEYDELNLRYRQALLQLRRNSATFLAVQEMLAALGVAAVLYGGGQGVLAGWATLGVLVAFVQYTERAFQPVLRLSEEYNSVQIGLGAAERVQRMLLTVPTIVDAPDARRIAARFTAPSSCAMFRFRTSPTSRCCVMFHSRFRPGKQLPSSARPAPANPAWSACWRGCTIRSRARCCSTASISAGCGSTRSGALLPWFRKTRCAWPGRSRSISGCTATTSATPRCNALPS